MLCLRERQCNEHYTCSLFFQTGLDSNWLLNPPLHWQDAYSAICTRRVRLLYIPNWLARQHSKAEQLLCYANPVLCESGAMSTLCSGNRVQWQPCAVATVCSGNPVPWQPCAVATLCRGNPVPWQPCAVATPCRGNPVPWQPCAVATLCRGYRRPSSSNICLYSSRSRRVASRSKIKYFMSSRSCDNASWTRLRIRRRRVLH